MDIDAMRKAAAQAGAMLRTLGNEDGCCCCAGSAVARWR